MMRGQAAGVRVVVWPTGQRPDEYKATLIRGPVVVHATVQAGSERAALNRAKKMISR